MSKYGVGCETIKIFESYLKNRTQKTSLKSLDVISTPKEVSIGVPQGSIIGPLLFSLYVNDMSKIADAPKTLLFADDCAMVIAGDSLQEVEAKIGDISPLIFDWLCANRLTLNTVKTYYQIYSIKGIKPDINIQFNTHKIARSNTVRYLGVIFDEKLSWKPHIDKTRNTIARNVGLISRAKFLLTKKEMKTLYTSLISPYFSYCSFIWGTTYPTNLLDLIRIQKRIVRRIEGVHHLAHSSPIFKKLDLLKFPDLVTQQQLVILHSFLNGTMPQSYSCYFKLWQPSRDTRLRLHFEEPFAGNNYRMFSFKNACPKAWNTIIASNIPDLADVPYSKCLFKKVTKKIFVDSY